MFATAFCFSPLALPASGGPQFDVWILRQYRLHIS